MLCRIGGFMRKALLGLLVLGLSVATLATSTATVLGTFYFYSVPDFTVCTAPEHQAPVHSLSIARSSDRHEASRAERQRPEFRIAERLGHGRLDPADHENTGRMDELVGFGETQACQRSDLLFSVVCRIPLRVFWRRGACRTWGTKGHDGQAR